MIHLLYFITRKPSIPEAEFHDLPISRSFVAQEHRVI